MELNRKYASRLQLVAHHSCAQPQNLGKVRESDIRLSWQPLCVTSNARGEDGAPKPSFTSRLCYKILPDVLHPKYSLPLKYWLVVPEPGHPYLLKKTS
uniref:Uncharacterized protein n=1 Tax=Timema tahoe TaxID=61484 RepID=A0A7R9IQ05_9NEOP|nr:unnamed protein product [Timema tahoe]